MPKLTLSFKGRLLDVYHIGEGQTLIGRDETCEIPIDSLAIAPFHARIDLDQTGCRILRLHEDFAMEVNRNPTESSAELNHGDVIQLGKHTLTYSEDAIELAGELPQKDPSDDPEADADGKSAAAGKGMLQIMNGENFGRIIPLNRNMTRIGRMGGDCAMIARRESGYYISHLEGQSSPLVNDHAIGDASQLLKDGDVIEVGTTQMQFHI
jgi:pSer/pThr/pTyr-binding forkhead associated (FHA) protein